jgi:hypothetical protein
MAAKKPAPVEALIICGSESYKVKLHWLPRKDEFLRLRLKGSAEPLCFKVDIVIHNIGEDETHNVDIHVTKSGRPRVTKKERHLEVH